MKIVEFKGQFRITIPKDLIESKGWEPGTKLRFVENSEGSIILKEINKEENEEQKKEK